MFGISISLVSILMIIIALCSGIVGDISIFPFLTKSYLFRNILITALLFIIFIESYFLFKKESAGTNNSSEKKVLFRSIAINLIQSFYLTLLTAPFIAICNVFLSVEFVDIVQPLLVFMIFVIVHRVNILLLAQGNYSYEKYMRVILILTFAVPLIAFCIWEFSEFPATILSYLSPVWFFIEILRGRILNIIPFIVIWLIPTISLYIMILLKSKKPVMNDRRAES